MNRLFKSLALLTLGFAATASADGTSSTTTVIANLKTLRQLHIPAIVEREKMGIGVAKVTNAQRIEISEASHAIGSCAGYKALPQKAGFGAIDYNKLLAPIEARFSKNQRGSWAKVSLTEKPEIKKVVGRVEEARLRDWVEWFSAFHDRFHANPTANAHATQLKTKIETVLKASKLQQYTVELVDHNSTKQKSLRVHLEGSKRPNEVVVIGGHYDSINMESIFGGPNPKGRAPGADDNASGSAAVLEALRLVAENGVQPERSIDFIWYAAEEVGLYGSQEIAASYKARKVNVIGVMQLDMTMFAGNGEATIATMTDFTSPWLRQFYAEINRLYMGAKLIESECGYGCSDHASWHDEGYPTVMPAEADMDSFNQKLHTERDVIDKDSNFKHLALFAKGATAFAMELGNNSLSEK